MSTLINLFRLLRLLYQLVKLRGQPRYAFETLWPSLFPHIQSADLYSFAWEWFQAGYYTGENRRVK